MVSNTQREQQLLKRSISGAIAIACLSVSFGLITGSQSIMFDGMFSILDAVLSSLALFVLRLIEQNPTSRRFQYGFWHIEPLVLVFNGSLLILLCFYAFINAIKSLLEGGNPFDLGWAMSYSFAVTVICLLIFIKQKQANDQISSPIIELDIKGWLISTAISGAIFCAFSLAWLLQRTHYAYLIPYVDSVILAVLILFVIPTPAKIVFNAIKEVLLITPTDLDNQVEQLMQQLSQRYGFITYSHYVTRIGRGMFLEVYVVLPEALEHIGISELDSIREHISQSVQQPGLTLWMSVSFCRDEKWL
ncbi:cation diffusion facilitator family transporter [Serratia microhaemolytica]|uniref:cation diffusion facilitator family transporter n=1 Tax=Serratia microhaemolytica TaxID=2675110 RepID=UPI000FDE1F53|nr:cation transporter [Serratia microhaemolytica]